MFMPQCAALEQQYDAAPLQESVSLPADAYPGKEHSFTSSSGQTVTFAGAGGLVPWEPGPRGSPAAAGCAALPGSGLLPTVQRAAEQRAAGDLHSTASQQAAYAPQYCSPQCYKAAAQQQEETVTLPADAYHGKQYITAAPTVIASSSACLPVAGIMMT